MATGPEARCGQRLPSGGESHCTPYGLKCPSCDAVWRAVVDPRAQRGRLWVPCHRLDTGSHLTLLVTHEWDAAWTLHATTAVRVEANVMVGACEGVLRRARQVNTP